MPSDFPAAFAALREILKRHSKKMIVQADTSTEFTLITAATGTNKKPMWFGAVYIKKSAVSFHLMPLYYNPELQSAVTPALEKRKQGKCCFNFQRPDPDLFADLDTLTKIGRAAFEKFGFLNPGLITPEQIDSALKSSGYDISAVKKTKTTKAKSSAKKA